jgi:hypothetical protein
MLRLVLTVSFISSSLWAKSIFLNGVDVSSAKNQSLKNVNVRISESGDIYIDAPHYEAKEEKTFLPLSRNYQGEIKKPEHQKETNRLPKVEDKKMPPMDAIEQPATP